MSQQVDLGQGVEIRDAAGKSAGMFVPDRMVQELKEDLKRSKEEVLRLKEELAALRAEHDRAIEYLTWKTTQQIEAARTEGTTLEQVIAEIEASSGEARNAG